MTGKRQFMRANGTGAIGQVPSLLEDYLPSSVPSSLCRQIIFDRVYGSAQHTLISMQPLRSPRSYCRSLFPGMGALRVAIVPNGIALSSARRSPGGPARGPEQGPGPANSAVAHLQLAVNTSKLRDAMPSIHPDGGRGRELVCSSSTGPGTHRHCESGCCRYWDFAALGRLGGTRQFVSSLPRGRLMERDSGPGQTVIIGS
ncbi:hypothetical protein M441DRAFT_51363 [Trichoderma asperellum CBS 433.97]|uniref:Uncharacterized protein n=1 Tax=Trichoderma asperellum (strain ATCC 204424 / CBS 433.97 / NBRC 101777) TaxID=1042311 RepID=A0A2T3YVQ6_TRIA4|nr:hypothetical protein M441DRAFT_51363 [Trichoderma asperellum CBS 433.97]PTB36653.1 hypothetical protein M441DRAFT_51363 [Trichoderma asperellum CBS 433.97]